MLKYMFTKTDCFKKQPASALYSLTIYKLIIPKLHYCKF